MRRIIDLTVIFHLRDKNIDCLFVFLSDNPHKTNGSTNVPFDRFSVITIQTDWQTQRANEDEDEASNSDAWMNKI